MVDVIGRIPNAARRTGLNGCRPLAERWAEGIDLLNRIAPDTGFNAMISEHNYDRLCDLIIEKQKAKAPPPLDAATREAAHEYFALQQQWNATALDIKNSQRFLEYAKDTWQHRLLKDISPDCFETPGTFDLSVSNGFQNAIEARQAAKHLETHLRRIIGVKNKIAEARRFDAAPADQRALELVGALAARFRDFKARIATLESQNMALEARVGRLEKPKKSKSKRCTPTKRKSST